MNVPHSRNVLNKKDLGPRTKKAVVKEESESQKKPQSQSKKNIVSTKKRAPERVVIDDDNIRSFAVEPAVSRPSAALSPVFRLPILEQNDLLHPKLQSSLPVLATIETLKSKDEISTIKKQAVEITLLKAQSCTVLSLPLEKKIFRDLKPITVNAEAIEKEFHTYSSSAAGSAPTSTAKEKEQDKQGQLDYPFKIRLKPLVETASFNQFSSSYGIKLMADKTLPADCCVSVAMKDLS